MTAIDRVPPTGTVTFLFSDIEGSTRLLQEIGDGYAEVLAQHRRILRAAFAAHDGVEIGTEGDSFFVAFARASDALAAATEGQRGLEAGRVRVRMGLHTGEPLLTDEGYVGMVVHRGARIADAAHGGQVLLSAAVAALVDGRLPDGVTLRDLGRVRLKDLAAPEQVYQVVHPQLRQTFPPLRSLEATPNNLPQQTTSFIGREREIAAIEALLAKTRLLTLTGSGGSGKTRLSLHAAADVVDQYPDGAWFVELASLAEPSRVPQTVATVLGLMEEPGKPMTEALVAHLDAKRVLLILDNCEHLLDACAKLADALVRRCAGVTILASSREALGIAGEQTYRVPSLSLPDRSGVPTPQTLSMYESVRLFIDRALLVRRDFEVTNRNAPALASLCHHVDGIPLAIELAAARVRSLSVEEIDRRLDQRFRLLTGGSRTALPRHQTLRALIDWSYDLLQDPERRLLQRLSVFVGGWTLEGAEAVCAGGIVDKGEILDLLTSLIDKNLVVADQSDSHLRYRLLETVRQYAQDRLGEGGDGDELLERHLDCFLALAEELEPKLLGAEQTECLQRLEEEHENLRASLDYGLVASGPGVGLRLCGALQRFWSTRGHLVEGQEWCVRALERPGAEQPTLERAKVLTAAGSLANFQGDYALARAWHTESLTIRRQLGDRTGMAASLGNLGGVALDQSDYALAWALTEECLAISRELGHREFIEIALGNLASVARQRGDHSTARTLNEESMAIAREQGDRGGVAASLNNLGMIALDQGDLATARANFEESLGITRATGGFRGITAALSGLGQVALGEGDLVGTRARYEESLAIGRKSGDGRRIADSLRNLGNVARLQRDYLAARMLYAESLAITRKQGDKDAIANSLAELAEMAVDRSDFPVAAGIWGAVERLREDVGSPMSPSEKPRYDGIVMSARAALGDTAFDRAWREGRALTNEQAIELALKKPADRAA